jgi:tetratricopeptide (TPR) repeat protein
MKNFWKSAALCLGAIAMVACAQKETITPSFPEQVVTDNDMTATKTVQFEANQDWELTVPQSTISYFWIEGNGGNRLNKMAGKAGSYKIKIGVSDEADFDKDIVCDVTLKMGGESKVIATLTLKKAEKVVKTYACKVNDGNFAYKQEGGFDFDTTAVATTVTLIEDATYGYSMPVLFDAGFAYELEGPEWLAVEQMSGVDLGKRGESGVVLEANLNKMTSLEKGTLKFKVRNSDEVVATLDVQMPDLSSFIEVTYDKGEFDKDGKYNFFDQTSDSLIINNTQSYITAMIDAGENSYASQLIDLSLQAYPNNVYFLADKAALLYQSGDLKGALNAYLKILKTAPNDYLVAYNIAYLYENMGDLKKARKYYKLATQSSEPDIAQSANQALEDIKKVLAK